MRAADLKWANAVLPTSLNPPSLDVASEQLHDPKLRGELSEPEVADLQSVVEIMIAGDPTLEAHLLVSPRDVSLDLLNDAAAPSPPHAPPPPGPPREEQPPDLGGQGPAPTAGPSLEVLRQLRLQRFCPSDTPSTPVSPPSAIASAAAAALVCEEVMEDSLPAMETAPAPADPPPTPSVGRDPSTVPVSSPPSFSFPDSFARPLPLPLLAPAPAAAPAQPTTSSAPAPVHPGGVVATSPTAAASSSSAAASAGATSLLLKSALPEAAYIPLSEVNSTKLTYLLDRLQQVPPPTSSSSQLTRLFFFLSSSMSAASGGVEGDHLFPVRARTAHPTPGAAACRPPLLRVLLRLSFCYVSHAPAQRRLSLI